MAAKPKVAFFEFTSCEGCQLTVVDSLQTHPELLEAVEIVRFREAMSEKGDDYADRLHRRLVHAAQRRAADQGDPRARRRSSSPWAPARTWAASTPSATARIWTTCGGTSTATRPSGTRPTPARPISRRHPGRCRHPRLPDRPHTSSSARSRRVLQGRTPRAARLPAVRRVQAQGERLPLPARQDLPGPDRPRRLRRHLPDLRRLVRGLPRPDRQPEHRVAQGRCSTSTA